MRETPQAELVDHYQEAHDRRQQRERQLVSAASEGLPDKLIGGTSTELAKLAGNYLDYTADELLAATLSPATQNKLVGDIRKLAASVLAQVRGK